MTSPQKSPMTSALEKLDRSIGKLDQAIDARINRLEKQQTDLFSQLEDERDRNRAVTRELDEIITQLEQVLNVTEQAR